MYHPVKSEMTIFTVTLLSYFSDSELVFGNAHCNDVVYYLLLPFIHGVQKSLNFTSLHPNSVTSGCNSLGKINQYLRTVLDIILPTDFQCAVSHELKYMDLSLNAF